MRNRLRYFRPVCDYLGLLVGVFGVLMLVPLAGGVAFARAGVHEAPAAVFWIPAAACIIVGLALKRTRHLQSLDNRRAMVLCALGWIVVSAIGAVPFYFSLPGVGFLDAYFETVSGFTTTGITVLSGLERLPTSILFWRSFIQWLGGLGILTFFLAVLYTGGAAHRLFGAESHKVFARRPAPSLLRTLRLLWLIYAVFTVALIAALVLEGLSGFDAACHAMTALSTGGYSPYDASVAQYRLDGHPHYVLIEYTLIVGMLLGGVNFFVHYRLLRGGFRALWDSLEMRLWWLLLAGATAVVALSRFCQAGAENIHDTLRGSLFQVTAIATTTGFATEDIATPLFPPAAKIIFLLLMVIGGCVGSTGGGIKVLRVGVLLRMAGRQVHRLMYGPAVVQPVVVDGEVVNAEELRRVAALFFAWVALLVFGGLVTALLSSHDALASASGMFSALGNIGPCYIPTPQMAGLHWGVKLVYILGMLAGRLEILPLLLLLSPRTWK